MTEHAAVIFVFFFLAEYASMVLMCILTAILFLGGYLYNFIPFFLTILHFSADFLGLTMDFASNPFLEGLMYGLSLGLKSCLLIFTFIWTSASFPRISFDQLMSFCWTVLLPIVMAFIVLVPCMLYSFEIMPCNIVLL